jgi:ATP adenylyltransferase
VTEDAAGLPQAPDGYERLWTPHRMVYVDGPAKVTSTAEHECPFCSAPRGEDADGLIVHRGRTCFVALNLFPYNPGHLLICPYRHVPDLVEMSTEERAESIELVTTGIEVLRATKRPTGFNTGMNTGAGAGAGIAGHAHLHVVPRWDGDANFLPIIARTKAVPELLDDTRAQLAAAWPQGALDGPR